MTRRSIGFPVAVLATSLVMACAAPAPAPVAPVPVAARPAPAPAPAPVPVPPAECSAAGARFAVGQALSPQLEAAARTRANAAVVRVLKPGQAVTMEFNAARLNLGIDAHGRVATVRCG